MTTAVALLSLPASLPAQPALCAVLPPPARVEPMTIALGVMVYEKNGRLRQAYDEREQRALGEVLAQVHPLLVVPPAPPPPHSSTRFGRIDSASTEFVPHVESSVSFTLHDDGRIQGVELTSSSIDPRADSLLLEGTRALAASSTAPTLLMGLAPVLGGKQVRVALFTSVLSARHATPVTWVHAPFYQRELPVYPGTIVEAALPLVGPHYPQALLRARQTGEVLVEFVVLPTGTVDKRSIRIVHASAREFGTEVRTWLPRRKFHPATIAGCPVPALVQEPHVFSIGERR